MNSNAKVTSVVTPAAGKPAGEHVWTPGADVQSVWKKYGWTPPSQTRVDYSKRTPPPLHVVRG